MRILHILPGLGNGGVEKVVMLWTAKMRALGYEIDFIVNGIQSTDTKNEIEKMGCGLYDMPFRYREFYKRKKFFEEVMDCVEYDVVHVHTCTSLDYLPLELAYYHGIPIRIAHSHSTGTGNDNPLANIMHHLDQRKMFKYATNLLACSKDAGRHLFGPYWKKGMSNVLLNGINIKKFSFDLQNRIEVREKLGVQDKVLLGNVGRYDPQKRQDKVVEILKKLSEEQPGRYALLMIGEGKCKAAVEQQVKNYGLDAEVVFISETYCIEKYYSAMDMLIFPSEREGLSLTLIEAQCAGVRCFALDDLAEETYLQNDFVKVGRGASISDWVEYIRSSEKNSDIAQRGVAYQRVKEKGLDVEDSIEFLRDIYNGKYQKVER